jgi:hypothetical protein
MKKFYLSNRGRKGGDGGGYYLIERKRFFYATEREGLS